MNDASDALQSEGRGKAAVRTHYMPFRLLEAQHAHEGPRSNRFGDINRKNRYLSKLHNLNSFTMS